MLDRFDFAQQNGGAPALSPEDEEVLAEFWGTLIFGILGCISSKWAQTEMPALPENFGQVTEMIASQQESDAPALAPEEEEAVAEFWISLGVSLLFMYLGNM